MDLASLPEDLKPVVDFHGHLCPGILIGYRAAKAAQEALGAGRSEDEELAVVAENNSCSVDAFQAMLSTTFGKGNLIYKDNGKQVFTLFDRKADKAVRVAFVGENFRRKKTDGGMDREAFMQSLLTEPTESLFKVERTAVPPPSEAVIEPSIICAACGEGAMASRTITAPDGRVLCLPCAAKEGL
jgi:formylmethanofuran dehydrogenase subunit E